VSLPGISLRQIGLKDLWWQEAKMRMRYSVYLYLAYMKNDI
jgi:hypothetical protein